MLALSIALVIIACIAGWLVNKHIDNKHLLNTRSVDSELSAAMEEQLKKFDDRLNSTWSTISSTKEELNAIKLAVGFRKHRE